MPSDVVGNDRFPLDNRPWVPVFANGDTQRVGLRELFLRAHEFSGLAVAVPPAASALMRVLYAMAARITGLHELADGDTEAWLDRRYELLEDGAVFEPDRVHAYFDEHAEGLRLHDSDRPFLQDPRLAAECTGSSGVNKLVMARPAGSNQVFFGHFTDAEQVALPSGEAALHLVAQLYYGPSGQCTTRTVDGQRYGNTMAGPLRRVLSCHPTGRNLYETLLLGVPAPDTWPQDTGGGDACPWEREKPIAPLAAPKRATGPLSMLTEQYQHAVLLRPGPDRESVVDATITWALRVNRPEQQDPYLIWDETKDGTLRPRDADADRALWRDLDAMILLRRSDGGRRPPVFDGLTGAQLPEPVFRELRVTAYGFHQDGQTRDRTYFGAMTPPLFALLDSTGTKNDTALALGVKEGREAAEKAAWHLLTALRAAWREYTKPPAEDSSDGSKAVRPTRQQREKSPGPWPEAALAAYWSAAEECFWALLDAEDFTTALPAFGRLALRIYDDITASVAAEPRGAKARESARGLVRTLLDHRRGRDR
ncbi:type I-E CRISPR-associated protein Cse1/CasA [Streptomyces sp. WMMC1477]|uniref:type I-E CRISPR-associated protein Cse1/CasA n=1 Tax=Streptomyces sp. WMMC1477 TaxID=3015155 RepID=UPI0022B70894|nr:type I-E CRISPR-associated protein Cse1/CasA [Streptomyces sp. WMMC1477]MCZ7430385.1 type I-E CRISPR-associated protein Cse1/CasA [Streptomyces sp. WMMC1477]